MNKIRTLVVDDEPLAGKLIASYVEKTPFLELASLCLDGVSALSLIEEGKAALAAGREELSLGEDAYEEARIKVVALETVLEGAQALLLLAHNGHAPDVFKLRFQLVQEERVDHLVDVLDAGVMHAPAAARFGVQGAFKNRAGGLL